MIDLYIEKRFDTSEIAANNPVVNLDSSSDRTPMNTGSIQETPVVESYTTAAPLALPLSDSIFEALNSDIPLAETFTEIRPIDKMIIQESQVSENMNYKIPLGEMKTDESAESVSIPYKAQISETVTQAAINETNVAALAALLNRDESEHFRTRWNEIQARFVDEPRSAVQQADTLVIEVVEQITVMFGKEHSSLEEQWKQGNDVSTEDLRKALQHYRSFFNRLVV